MSGFFFFFSSAALICFSSCVVSLNGVYLTEILSLSIFCVLLSFKQTVYKKSEIQKILVLTENRVVLHRKVL